MEYGRFKSDESFRIALDVAVEDFRRYVGRDPVAFRNGSYFIKSEWLRVIRAYGIKYDSTIYAFKNFMGEEWQRCRSIPYNIVPGVVEIPVNWILLQRSNKGDRQPIVSQFTTKKGTLQTAQNAALLGEQRSNRPPIFFMGLIHSFTLLNEERGAERSKIDTFNRILKANVPSEFHYRWNCMGDQTEYVFIGNNGPFQVRIDALENMLDAVSQSPRLRAMTFQDLKDFDLVRYMHNAMPVDPIPEYLTDSNSLRYSWLRRYSASYLRSLESSEI